MTIITAEQMKDAINSLLELKEKYLSENGWKYSCNHFDCCWRWQKEVSHEDGKRTYYLDLNSAVNMQIKLGD